MNKEGLILFLHRDFCVLLGMCKLLDLVLTPRMSVYWVL